MSYFKIITLKTQPAKVKLASFADHMFASSILLNEDSTVRTWLFKEQFMESVE
jgi:hypothetical protein